MSTNYNNADSVKTDPEKEKQTVEVNLYLGIFFDGTNNNKVQSMIALTSRRKNFFKKYKKELKHKFPQEKDFTKLSRDKLKEANIGTVDELDNIFGPSQSINLDIENKIVTDNTSEFRYSSAAEKFGGNNKLGFLGTICKFLIDDARREKLSRSIGNAPKKIVVFKELWSISTSQGSGYTNVALLNSLYKVSEKPIDESARGVVDFYHSIYVEGSGANDEINVPKQIYRMYGSIVGLGFGVNREGVINKCKKAIDRVTNIYTCYATRENVIKINCHFDIFGFSRGAATARCFTYVLNPKGEYTDIEQKRVQAITGKELPILNKKTDKLGTKNVRSLGIFDTVASIGLLRESSSYIVGKNLKIPKSKDLKDAKSMFHDTNVDDFGLYATDQADNVLHICALDEFRKNFALVDIESSIKSNNGTEVYIPGCHTDIGGGAALGLDAFKIINCDEIATRGKILFNLYVRISGIAEVISSIKSISADVAKIKSLALSYSGIKSLFKDIHKAVCGFYSLLTGYENFASYKIVEERKKPPVPRPDPDKDDSDEKEEKGYSLLVTLDTKIMAVLNAKDATLGSANKVVSNAKGLVENRHFELKAIKDLISNGTKLVEGIEKCIEAIKSLIKELKAISNHERKISLVQEVKGVRDAAVGVIISEIADWQNNLHLMVESKDMLMVIFKGEKEYLFIPIEQRRICLPIGVPYNPNFSNDSAKNNKILPLSVFSLKKLGWLSEKTEAESESTWVAGRPSAKTINRAKETGKSIVVEGTKVVHFFKRHNIGVCKYSKPGYPLVAFRAMYDWANDNSAGGQAMFDVIPEGLYKIPKDLEIFSSDVSSKCKGKGRKICVPSESEEINYHALRKDYLHISMNQQILSLADNGLVNGPNVITVKADISDLKVNECRNGEVSQEIKESCKLDNVVTRRIYQGIKNSPTAGGKEYVDKPKKQMSYLGDSE